MCGNNGSWTNSDDVHITQAVKFFGQGGNSKVARDPQPRVCKKDVDCNNPNCKFAHPSKQPLEIVQEQPQEPTGENPPKFLCYLGGVYNRQYYVFDTSIHPSVRTDNHVLVSYSAPDKDGKVDPMSFDRLGFKLFSEEYIPNFTAFGIRFSVERFITFSPMLLLNLMQGIPVPSHDKRNFEALERKLRKENPACPLEILDNTLIVYAYNQRTTGEQLATFEKIFEFTRYVYGTATMSSLFRITPVNSTKLNNWGFNRRWKIIDKHGFTFKYEGNRIKQYPTFNTLENQRIKYMVLGYFRFVGYQPSAYYEINGFNITSASSRLFSSRDNEENLYNNQLQYMQYVDNSFMRLCDSTLEVDVDMKTPDPYPESGILHFIDVTERIDHYHPCYLSRGWKVNSYTIRTRSKKEYYVDTTKFNNRISNYLVALNERYTPQKWYDYIYHLMKVGYNYFVESNKYLLPVLQRLKFEAINLIYSPLREFLCRFQWLQQVVLLPAVKRNLYQSWFNKRFESIDNITFYWELKLKREPGKFGKAARFYASSEEHCLLDKITPDLIKFVSRDKLDLYDYGCSCHFYMLFSDCQESSQSDRMFQFISEMPNKSFYCVYFSDDMFIAHKDIYGNLIYLEGDISMCDASTGPAVFGILHERVTRVTSASNANAVISQCSNPARCINPSNPQEYFIAQPDTFCEYSGYLGTTLLNNINVELALITMAANIDDRPDLRSIDIMFDTACFQAGLKITSDVYYNLNQVTFLKRAYNGKHSWLVLGVLLRSIGIVDTVVTHETFGWTHSQFLASTEIQQMNRLIELRVLALQNEPGNPILNAFRTYVNLEPLPILVTYSDILNRYGGEEYDYVDLCTQISRLGLGVVVTMPAICHIMQKDYGITKT